LEHARLYSQLTVWLDSLTALRAIDTAITSSFDLDWSLGILLVVYFALSQMLDTRKKFARRTYRFAE
jgi:hypothetical protein